MEIKINKILTLLTFISVQIQSLDGGRQLRLATLLKGAGYLFNIFECNLNKRILLWCGKLVFLIKLPCGKSTKRKRFKNNDVLIS